MEQYLTNLYNAMLKIETKGASTLQMAECIRYTEQLIRKGKEMDEELDRLRPKQVEEAE